MKPAKIVCGFSLVELLLAVFLGLFLFEVLLHCYLNAKNVYCAQNDLVELSENMRFADFILWQNIMQAGFAGYRPISKVKFSNHVSDKPALFFGIRGYASGNVPNYLLKSKVVEGTDVIVIGKSSSEATGLLTPITKNINNRKTTYSFEVKGKNVLPEKPILLISDCEKADLFKAKVDSKSKITTDAPIVNKYSTKTAQIRQFEEMTFFIKYPSDKENCPNPGLYFCVNRGRVEELISNISSMKIFYGLNGSLPTLKARDVSDGEWDRVSNVEIVLTMYTKLKLASKKKRISIKIRR